MTVTALNQRSPSLLHAVSRAGWIQIGVTAALMLFLFWDTIRGALVGRWLSDGNWSHGWLIPAFSLYFLHTHRHALARARPSPSWWGALVLVSSLVIFFAGGWILRMTYPQVVSIVGVIFGTTLLIGGWPVMRVVWFPICFLLLAVPLPPQHYVALTRPLRELATDVASGVLPLVVPGLYTESQAVVIDYILPGPGSVRGQLNVEEACSGMRLMMAFVTLGVAMAYLKQRPFWQRAVLVAACVPISVFCNAIRVTVTGYLHVSGHTEWAQGTPHQMLGMAMLVLALGLFALLGYILEHLLIEHPE